MRDRCTSFPDRWDIMRSQKKQHGQCRHSPKEKMQRKTYTGGFRAAVRAAAGADVLHVHLHTAFPPEFVDLRGEGNIHHITGLDGNGSGIGGRRIRG